MKTEKKLFKYLSKKQFQALYAAGESVSFQKGEIIIQERSLPQAIYFVLKGRLQVEKTLPGINKVLGFLEPGEFFGELFLVSPKPWRLLVKAAEAASLIRIDRKILNSLDTDLQLFFYKRMAGFARDKIIQLEKQSERIKKRDTALMHQLFSLATARAKNMHESVLIQEVISKVPRLPIFAVSLAAKLLDGDISPRDVALEVTKDPSLAGMILKTINSSYRGLAGKVSDVHHAIMLLGYNEVSQIIIAEGVKRTLPDSLLFRELYDHSLAISLLSFEISKLFNVGKPSEIATISILHELGQIVVQLLKIKNPKLEPLFDLVDTPQMGTMLLQSWELPEVVCSTIEFHGYPEFALPLKVPAMARTNVGILYLAHLFHGFLKGQPDTDLPMIFYDHYLGLLKIEQLPLASLVGDKLLPALVRKLATLPTGFILILEEFVEQNKMVSLYHHFNEF